MKDTLILSIIFSMVFSVLSCKSGESNINVRILSMEKKVDTDASDYEICDEFTLKESDVIHYFSLAKEVDSNEFNAESIILPCKYKGKIKIDDKEFQWEIYAGGSGYLYNKSEDKRYLCKSACCKSLPEIC